MAFLQREIHSPLLYEEDAPSAPALKIGDFIFLSGILGKKRDGTMEDGIEQQTRQLYRNIENLLAELSLTLHDVMKMTVYLKDPKDLDAFNCISRDYLSAPYPARSVVFADRLENNADVMIDGIAINTHSIRAQEDEYHKDNTADASSRCSTCSIAQSCSRRKA